MHCKFCVFLPIFLSILANVKSQEECPVEEGSHPEFYAELKFERTKEEGRNVTFSCRIHNFLEQGTEVSWSSPDQIFKVNNRTEWSLDERYIVKWEGCDRFTLNILNITVADSGVYKCQIHSDPVLAQETRLYVLLPGMKNVNPHYDEVLEEADQTDHEHHDHDDCSSEHLDCSLVKDISEPTDTSSAAFTRGEHNSLVAVAGGIVSIILQIVV